MNAPLASAPLGPRERFEPLRQALIQDNTKVVVALGGGGVKMFAHATVFQFLENLGVEKNISEIWGASGGAILGFIYSMGFKPEEIREYGLTAFRGDVIPFIPTGFSIFKKIMKDMVWPSKRAASSRLFQDYQAALIRFIGKIAEGRKQQHKFFATAYNVDTQENDILTEETVLDLQYPDKIYHVSNLDAVAASSSVPILFHPKVIEDEYGKRTYIDGAMVEDVPTASVYKKWMRDKELGLESRRQLLVIAVNLYPNLFLSINALDHWMIKRIPGYENLVMSMKCANYMHTARTKAQKRLLREDPNVELWDINLTIPGGSFLSLDLIPKVFEISEEFVPKQFAEINDRLLF